MGNDKIVKEADDILLPLFPNDDFSKLLFAQKRIEELSKENTVLFSDNLKLINEITELKNDAVIRKYSSLKKENKNLRAKIAKIRKDNNDLIYRLNRKPIKLDTQANSPYDLNKLKRVRH
jgi:predicted nuclease with TOPRIM domain